MCSIIMISMGILGTYLAKVFEEVKERPIYVVAQNEWKGKPPEKLSDDKKSQ